jgi:hypothetical protein
MTELNTNDTIQTIACLGLLISCVSRRRFTNYMQYLLLPPAHCMKCRDTTLVRTTLANPVAIFSHSKI